MESNINFHHRCVISAFTIVLCCCCCCITHTCADCSKQNYTEGTQYAGNVETVMDNLIKASKQAAAFNISVVGHGNDTVRGLFQCRGDKTASDCFSCAQSAKYDLHKKCKQKQTGSTWSNETCFMRYRYDNFTGRLDLEAPKLVDRADGGIVSDPENFNRVVNELLTNLSVQAVSSSVSSPGYASGFANSTILTVYGMVQCWEDLSVNNCRICLNYNIGYILSKYSGIGGAEIVGKNCLTRYATDEFFAPTTLPNLLSPNPASPPPPPESGGYKAKVAVIVGAIGGSVLILLLLLGGLHVWFKRPRRKSRGPLQLQDNILKTEQDPTIFSLKYLQKVTNDFHEELKLGEGAFGAVYKGTLPNGTDIAVKKLSLISIQGQQECLNEIKLLIKIQHRNLVRLLGCCVDGSQKMLVYEYLSNKSIDKILFDPNKKILLDWRLRFHVILGVAKGLVYLHEDSKYKVIHRDIKAANILLDDHFNPKIADFGLAKLCPENQTKLYTRAAGTFGYMAPEYAIKGQLSTKADVYSFGVLVMEIIQGRKITNIDQCQGSIIEKAWKSFQQGNVVSLIDDNITSTCEHEQVRRCIHLGLLCVQSDPCLRPSMFTVVLMLSSNSIELPNPTLPAFLDLNSNIGDAASGSERHACSQGNQSSILSFPR